MSDEEQPSLGLVGECMDMFRQAAELYSAAGDPRHEEVRRKERECCECLDSTFMEERGENFQRNSGFI